MELTGEMRDAWHEKVPGAGVLLANLGTPDAPTPAALRRYLAEFLSDPRVIELPRIIWWPILHGIILRTRPRAAAGKYRKIWTEAGSPLLRTSGNLTAALNAEISSRIPGPVHVRLGMRYGEPSVATALRQLGEQNVRRILILPLYPQYSATTTASTYDAVMAELAGWRWWPELRLVNHYHDEPVYITALTESISRHWNESGREQKLLFSFHGLPERYFLSGDPYFCECHKTARLVAERLELADTEWAVSFQSRFGREKWLRPYTDETLRNWGRTGVRQVAVICPGFAADCLETLEEIGIENRTCFLDAGGERFSYIPALNDSPLHVNTLTDLVMKHCSDWPEFSETHDAARLSAEQEQIRQRAASLHRQLQRSDAAE